jgi:TolB-like protein/DNA-binding winged helix-turn-helix (wHTH) protein
MASPARPLYSFGSYRLDPADQLLYRDGEIVPLRPKVFDTLLLLVANQGRVLSKDEMMKQLWPDTFVEEGTLAQYVSLLKKALGPDGCWIENFPRRGYRFTAAVETVENGVAQPQIADPLANGTPVLVQPATSRRFPRRLVLLALLLLALTSMGVLTWLSRRSTAPVALNSVAVLPFRTVSDSQSGYMADGFTEALITRLTNLPGLRVVSYSRVRRYRNQTGDAAQIGRELGVGAVIEGTIRSAEGRIRITVHGVDVQSGLTIWAIERLESRPENLLELERQLAEETARRVRGQLSASERKLVSRPASSSAEAYNLFLKARNADNETAARLLSRAIELDPQFADAYGWLAYVQQMMFTTGLGGLETSRKASSNVNRALSLNPDSTIASRSLGFIHHSGGQAIEGLLITQRALERHPDDLEAIAASAEAHFRVGLYDRAITLYENAIAGEPTNASFRTQLARMFLYLGQHERGMQVIASLRPEQAGPFGMVLYLEAGQLETARRIARIDSFGPYWLFGVYMRMYVLTRAGDPAGARETGLKSVHSARRFLDLGENPWIYAFRGMVQARLGQKAEALESAGRAVALDPRHHMFLFFDAQTRSLLGLRREALDTLKAAVANGFLNLPMLEFHSRSGLAFHPLRDEPEFAAIRADMAKRIDVLRARY